MVNRIIILLAILMSCTPLAHAQNDNQGRLSGGFQMNANVFLRDSLIGAANIPQYDNEIFGGEAWLDLNYAINGFDVGLRFDLFNNSNLLNPRSSYTDQGIGRWHISKKIKNLGITVGHIYDQIGSGVIYRSFEERSQLIDNAVYGARLKYDLGENWKLKGIAGKQRFLFDVREGTLKAINLEGYVSLSDTTNLSFAPGFGFVNRTLSENAMTSLVNVIKNYSEEDLFKPEFNTYLGSFYNTLSIGKIAWYVEAAYKSEDAILNPFAVRTDRITGAKTTGKLVRESGTLFYSSLSFATKGLGITIEGKRTENFNFRTDPQLRLINGIVNYLPAMNRQNTYRLTTRYSPATQDLSEQAVQLDVKYKASKKLTLGFNTSYIDDLDSTKLYRELYFDALFKPTRKWQITGGVQRQEYNQEVYEIKPEVPIVETITPFFDVLHKISRKKSIRAEFQYMLIGDDLKAGTKQDYGDWAFMLLEYAIAPHWTFTLSDMYNVNPGKNSPSDDDGNKLKLHYPRADIYYTNGPNRYSFSYVKQVEGIVCSGGICRLEPAFSGYKFSVSSTF